MIVTTQQGISTKALLMLLYKLNVYKSFKHKRFSLNRKMDLGHNHCSMTLE